MILFGVYMWYNFQKFILPEEEHIEIMLRQKNGGIKTMYQVGECIMYKNIGICIVEDIGKLSFSAEKEKDYYTLRPLHGNSNSRIYVPVDTEVFMRNAITRQEASRYLTELEKMQTKPFCAKRTTQLKAYYDGLLTKHDLTERLRVFKELCQKEKKVKANGKKFGQLETGYKNHLETLLADEFSCALDETVEASKQRLYKALF